MKILAKSKNKVENYRLLLVLQQLDPDPYIINGEPIIYRSNWMRIRILNSAFLQAIFLCTKNIRLQFFLLLFHFLFVDLMIVGHFRIVSSSTRWSSVPF